MRKDAVLLFVLFSLPAFAGSTLECEMKTVYSGDGMSSQKTLDVSKLSLRQAEVVSAPLISACPSVIGYPSSDTVTYVFYLARVQKREDGSTACGYTEVSYNRNVSNLSCVVK
ncbi:MAG: hypothetical protein ACJ763_19105 [Bdellovibrionia bacterium]